MTDRRRDKDDSGDTVLLEEAMTIGFVLGQSITENTLRRDNRLDDRVTY